MWWRTKHDLPPGSDVDVGAAKQEREKAEEQLERVRDHREEVSNVVSWLRDVKERNHFAESIKDALTGTQDDRRDQ